MTKNLKKNILSENRTLFSQFIFIFLLAIFSLFISSEAVFSTVGGPTIIERLSYSPNENSLYYIVNDEGGRGCPPVIEKLDLSTKERTEVKSCDEIVSTYYRDESSIATYHQFIEDTFKYPAVERLPIIHLANNNISIIVEYLGEHRFDEYNVSSDFRAIIFQDNQKKSTIDFIGCYQDQPNVFKGYIIPDTNKIAIVISRIGKCFEGGYTKDDVYILDDMNFLDTKPVGYDNYFSEPGVYRGNLVVLAQDNKTATSIPSETKTTPLMSIQNATQEDNISGQQKKRVAAIVLLAVTFIMGILFGYLAGKKFSYPSEKNTSARNKF